MTKRTRFLISSVFISVLPLVLGFLAIHHHLIVLITLGVTVFTAYWSQKFDLKRHEYFIFPIPLLLVIGVSFPLIGIWNLGFVSNFEFRISNLFFLIGEGITLYITFLTLNILNAATVRTVPLKKAALSTLYFLSLVLTALFSHALLSSKLLFTNYYLLITLPIWIFAIAVAFLYYATEKLRVLEAAVLALLVGELAIASVFIASESLMRVVFVTGGAFMMLGALQHHLNKDLSKKLRREYLIIGLILVAAFLFQ